MLCIFLQSATEKFKKNWDTQFFFGTQYQVRCETVAHFDIV